MHAKFSTRRVFFALLFNSQGRTAERMEHHSGPQPPRAGLQGWGGAGGTPGPCGIRTLTETRRTWAVGAEAPGILPRQRLEHREQDILLE